MCVVDRPLVHSTSILLESRLAGKRKAAASSSIVGTLSIYSALFVLYVVN